MTARSRRRYSESQFREAVRESRSVAEALRKLGLSPHGGGGYESFYSYCEETGTDWSHFKGQGWLRGGSCSWSQFKARPLEEILVEDSTYLSTANLKRRLIKEGVFEDKCYECGLKEWRGSKLPTELHHKNGNRRDNRLSNLIILCRNCHGLTQNFRQRNGRSSNGVLGQRKHKPGRNRTGRKRELNDRTCPTCHKEFRPRRREQRFCSYTCSSLSRRKRDRPNKAVLLRMVNESSVCAVARDMGVSDNTIRKWIKFGEDC